jgi:hypothetical protein
VGTALTDRPFGLVGYEGQDVRIETSAEIIAKKMWFRDFEEIDALAFRMPFDECVELAREIIQPVVQRLPAQTRRRIRIPHRTRIKR